MSSLFTSSLKLQPIHKFLLTTFLSRRKLDNLPVLSHLEWTQALGADPFEVTKEFIENNLIVRSSLQDHLNHRFTISELQKLLKDKDFPLSGTKAELITRLIQAGQSEVWQLVSEYELYECSEKGERVIEDYLKDLDKADKNSIAKTLQISTEKLRLFLAFVLGSATSGIIGNRADALTQDILTNDHKSYNPLAVQHLLEGISYVERGQFDRALEEYSKAIEVQPDFSEGYAYLGELYLKKGNSDLAINACSTAIRLDPNFAISYWTRGVAYEQKQNYSKSLHDFNQTIKLRPDTIEAYCGSGLAYYHLGEYKKALETINNALKLKPNHSTAIALRNMVEEKIKPSKGVVVVEHRGTTYVLTPNNQTGQ